MSRRPVPSRRTLRFFGGKGGVGKTTCAAAAALVQAERGAKVLVVSTDPAHSLADALGVKLSSRPRRVPLPKGRGALHAVEQDADGALDKWLAARGATLRTIAARGTYLEDDDIERFFGLALPGVDELMGLVELDRLARAGGYHDVVVDTAPTGHTLRLLAMPETLSRIAAVLDDMQRKHRFMAQSLGGRYRADASDALIDELASYGEDLHALLRDPARTSFSWVVLPEAMAVAEAADGIRALTAAGMPVAELIINRATPRPDGPCRLCEGRVASEADAIAEIAGLFPTISMRTVPVQVEEPRGVARLRAVGRWMLGTRAAPARARPRRRARAGAGRHPGANAKAPAWLAKLVPAGTLMVLFGGKGGVGKTTCAATTALALAAARPREKILLLSADPAHSLGDALAMPLGDDERKVPGAGRLWARELSADQAFQARRDRYRASVDELFDRLRAGSRFDAAFDRAVVQDLVDLTPPGLDELLAILVLVEASERFDVVVVDTAPTGHALRLLEMPASALDWVRAFLAILLKYREVVGLGEMASDLLDVSRELRQLDALLRDPRRTRFIMVARPAELPRKETARLQAALRRLGIGAPALVVNAVTPPGCARCRRAARAEAAELRKLARLCSGGPACSMLAAPAVSPPPRGGVDLRRWGQTWTIR